MSHAKQSFAQKFLVSLFSTDAKLRAESSLLEILPKREGGAPKGNPEATICGAF